jgi:hypothetical protein
VRDAFDEPVEAESAQVISHATSGELVGVDIEQRCEMVAQTAVGEPVGLESGDGDRREQGVDALIRSVLLRHRGFPGLLRDVATPDERRQLYAGLGITVGYERRTLNGQARELFRPSLRTVPGEGSNSPCRRGDLVQNPRTPYSPDLDFCLSERFWEINPAA